MSHGTYVGPIQHLIGHSALLRDPGVSGKVVAQFDNRTLRRLSPEPLDFEGQMRLIDEAPADALGFGWHVFNASEFVGTAQYLSLKRSGVIRTACSSVRTADT